ncbi:MAG: hypothetical protein IT449_08215 [Phycisphaerales bacterium]|nr:hypothetical protein [Phycisphaerales bacterium]
MKPRHLLVGAAALLLAACNADLNSDPNGLFESFSDAMNNLERRIEQGLADPLDSDPYPLLIGGDDERVLYATNLGDIRLNYKGSTNDVVLPGFIGPSNLYEHRNGRRELIRPLIPSGAFGGLASDGDWIAYIWDANLQSADSPLQVVVGQVGAVLDDAVVFEEDLSGPVQERLSGRSLVMDDNRLAYLIQRTRLGSDGEETESQSVLRIHDLTLGTGAAAPEIELGLIADQFDLRGDALAYLSVNADLATFQLVLHNLDTGEAQVIEEHTRSLESQDVVYLTLNTLVWSEPTSGGLIRVSRFDLAGGGQNVWADSVVGRLVGATDDFFITEERVENFPDEANRIVVRRYNAEGVVTQLADFRADGLAGQSRILGNRAAWVNPDREIVLAPLAGGDRTQFKPF